MPWLIDVNTATLGYANRQSVETLDQTQSISFWMLGWKNRQYADHPGSNSRDEYRAALAGNVCCNSCQVQGGFIGRHQDKNRIAFRNHSDRTVLELSTAKRFSLNVAHLLQLQGCFLRDGKCWATT